jgi:tetratricopeptide (TPR) repeat protein
LNAAIAEQRRAIALDSDYADGHGNLGYTLTLKGEWKNGFAELKQAARIDPEPSGWPKVLTQIRAVLNRYDAATTLMQQGRMDEAVVELRDVLRTEPFFAIAHQALGAALAFKGDYDQAIAEEKISIGLNPDMSEAHSALGEAFSLKHQWHQAISEMRLAVKLDSGIAGYHYLLGRALASQGDLQSALAEYLKAYQLDPNNSDYREAYEKLRKELGS